MRRSSPIRLLILTLALLAVRPSHAAELPATLTDQEFWRLLTELSEAGGVFQAELMSNEDSSSL
jgi:hypothetical protein